MKVKCLSLIIIINVIVTCISLTTGYAEEIDLSTSMTGSTMDLTKSIDKVRTGIVQVSIQVRHSLEEVRNNPRLKMIENIKLGTGFFVNDDGYVATNLHVVASWKPEMGDLKALVPAPNIDDGQIFMTGGFSGFKADVVATDAIHDLAILKLTPNPFVSRVPTLVKTSEKEIASFACSVPQIDIARPKDGEHIASSGYPFNGKNVLVTTSGYIASSWEVETAYVEVEGAPPGFKFPQISNVYLANLTINPGNSGGPVYRAKDGVIMGVCVSQILQQAMTVDGNQVVPAIIGGKPLLYNSNVANIIPVKYVVDLLEKNNLKVGQPDKTKTNVKKKKR